MTDFLDTLAADAKATVASGYYAPPRKATIKQASLGTALCAAVAGGKVAVISEVKAASPSKGTIRENFDAAEVAKAMVAGGAAGISVLTEPKHFNGSLENLRKIRAAVDAPILMKDIIVNPLQLSCASRIGANAVLLIQAVFDRGYCAQSLEAMIAEAHARGLEVLLETHTEDEFKRAQETGADLIGINNRSLATLKIDLQVTKRILQKNSPNSRLIVSESGINTPADLHRLQKTGANAFLIGSSIMEAGDVESKVKDFVNGYE
jgi:indole-3-glycerol phosphate synthase